MTGQSRGPQLIVYADRLGGTVARLDEVLRGPLAEAFAGVHLLPFFTPYDGADAGFDPVDHTVVDPRLGTWNDVQALADGRELAVDLIVNHVSADSHEFRDVLARGDASPYADMFLTMSDVYPEGAIEADLAGIFRPRPGLPFTPMTLGGRRRLVWTTFTPKQIDLDVRSPGGGAYLDRVLGALAAGGATVVRLDAVGYAVKTAGTSSFMTDETLEFIDGLVTKAHGIGVEVLVETHAHFARQVELARRVDWVYDFALGPLVLHTLYTGSPAALGRWLEVRPANAMTVLDTHDGIGVIDVGPDQLEPERAGLLTAQEVEDLVESIHGRSGGQSRRATGWAASNLDVYQVNCTYYDALSDPGAYLIARAIQLFVPGVPQVYYVGLLAGRNDMALLASTGVGRDINRHRYTPDELEAALGDPVVVRQLELLALRKTHPAFDGVFEHVVDGSRLTLSWLAGDAYAVLDVDLAAPSARLRASGVVERSIGLSGSSE
ncbi:sucrose phosphorylase [Luteimicrobium album]|uniref:Sucrose phosphorylase n=1 Tax=Luteimicrobium album TaxID=1054550 RepID=A0ABQ6I207_9MICO|nr:sucrose phosphorylase [Luteimicrobium album]GMA24198.1 sucrose phosphorylase [Luteimicrobium album]